MSSQGCLFQGRGNRLTLGRAQLGNGQLENLDCWNRRSAGQPGCGGGKRFADNPRAAPQLLGEPASHAEVQGPVEGAQTSILRRRQMMPEEGITATAHSGV